MNKTRSLDFSRGIFVTYFERDQFFDDVTNAFIVPCICIKKPLSNDGMFILLAKLYLQLICMYQHWCLFLSHIVQYASIGVWVFS